MLHISLLDILFNNIQYISFAKWWVYWESFEPEDHGDPYGVEATLLEFAEKYPDDVGSTLMDEADHSLAEEVPFLALRF